MISTKPWGLALAGILLCPALPALAETNPTLKIGILQRFGEAPSDKAEQIKISAPTGSTLTLQFSGSDGKPQTTKAPQVTVTIVNQALTPPELVQRLILSSHLSYESAEASAKQWQTKGIQTELAQPNEWQVWAKRDTYNPDQLTQIALFAQQNQIPAVRLFQQQRPTQPLLSWEADFFRYNRTQLAITSGTGSLKVEAQSPQGTYIRTYAGSVAFQPNAYGNYTLVNQVPLETYLRGVVPHEIGPGAPPSAIAAQAILARTYVLRNRHRFDIDDYQLCANTQCQVYRGLTDTLERTDAAVTQTAGQVLTYQGDLIDAVYSSTNGGVSAAFEDTWDGDPRPYLQPILDIPNQNSQRIDLSKPDAFRQFLQRKEGFNEVGVSKLFRWRIPLTLATLSDELRQSQPYLGLVLPTWTQVAGLKVLTRSASGRVQTLQVDLQTDNGLQSITLPKDKIRLAFNDLYSTMFDVDPILEGDQLTGYVFLGGGFGHGVGMSQYGSYTLSRLGYSSARILDFYYPGTTLTSLSTLTPKSGL